MNLEEITPKVIVDKFNKFLNRIICDMLREHRQTGQIIVDKINLQERPENIYEVKVFVEALNLILPSDESIVGMDWYLKLKSSFRRWDGIVDALTVSDYRELTVNDITNLMLENKDKLEELMSILEVI